MKAAYARAREDYPVLLGIHECLPEVFREPTRKLLDTYNYHDWEQQFWELHDDSYLLASSGSGNIAGHVVVLRKGSEERIAMFLQRCPEADLKKSTVDSIVFAEFVHELGHVDDYANGLHLVPSTTVDMQAAEEHAHHVACRRIMSESKRADEFSEGVPSGFVVEWQDTFRDLYRPIMGFYIGEMLPKLAEYEASDVRHAAENVLRSQDYVEYREFASDYMPG